MRIKSSSCFLFGYNFKDLPFNIFFHTNIILYLRAVLFVIEAIHLDSKGQGFLAEP